MKRLLKWFENTMSAVAFAEEGEFETAKKIFSEETYTLTERERVTKRTALAPERPVHQEKDLTKRLWKRFEDALLSISFAKAGDLETAKEILRKTKQPLSEESKELRHQADSTLSTIDELTSMAITFAEAGEFKAAWELLNEAEDSVKRVMKVYQRYLNDMILTPKMSSA